jgi:hypothetical protein
LPLLDFSDQSLRFSAIAKSTYVEKNNKKDNGLLSDNQLDAVYKIDVF